ncbi:hypothetical protein SLS62_006503 [Diatrype stigma]|uniref:Ubiquitin-conjugating enzyme n=1 Tax=Diatrype stigma TaxID=117547 RepID=A0AAN9V111_9PEZI
MHISFPDSYPRLPPLVTFSTDMFHPLISPLSTYMYTAEAQDDGAISATAVERLPPGGFSLVHGFPGWFGRGSGSTSGSDRKAQQTPPPRPINPSSSVSNDDGTPYSKRSVLGESPGFAETNRKDISTFEVLRYIRSTFDDEDVLDSIPLAAAGNPGAWHAWRTHRTENGVMLPQASSISILSSEEETASVDSASTKPTTDAARTPGEWNWEGVWEERVKKGIAASLSEPVLFGGIGGSDEFVSLFHPSII